MLNLHPTLNELHLLDPTMINDDQVCLIDSSDSSVDQASGLLVHTRHGSYS